MAVVRAKLLPPRLLKATVARPELIARLDDLWTKPLGLIVAPAGFGKSTLARSWTDRTPERISWITLDSADNEVDRFVQYLLEAIAGICPAYTANTRTLFERSSRPAIHELAETLADELMDADHDFCIVVDEAEQLTSSDAWSFLEGLIRLAPPHLHLLVLSRVDPPLPIARLQMREQLVQLRGGDLLFHAAEISSIFAEQGVALPDADVDSLLEVTHGWPAGVRLALARMSSLAPSAAGGMPIRRQQAEFVLDPLAAELIEGLPLDVSESFLATSIVDEVHPRLLRALVDRDIDSSAVFDTFARAGMLLETPPRGGGWIRFHPLFRDLFRRQLTTRASRGEIDRLNQRAAAWFVTEGDVASAVHHLVEGRDSGALVTLLSTEIPAAIDREDWTSVADWLRAIPDEIIATSPPLMLGQCWVLFFNGNWLAMRALRESCRSYLATLPQDDEPTIQWQAELTILEATEIGSYALETSHMLTRVEEAAARVSPERRFVRGHVSLQRAMALEDLGRNAESDAVIAAAIGRDGGRVDAAVIRPLVARCFILRQRGEFAQLEVASRELGLLAAKNHLPLAAGWAQLFASYVLYQRNDLVAAESALTELATNHDRVHIACLMGGMQLLASLYRAQGDRTEMEAVIRRLREILTNHDSVELLPSVASVERLLLYLDDPDSARGATMKVDPQTVIDAPPHSLNHPVTTAVVVQSGQSPESAAHALHLAEIFGERVAAVNFPIWEPEVLALKAVALSALDREGEARAAMRAALTHRFTRQLTRAFLDLGPHAHKLYRELREDEFAGEMATTFLTDLQFASREPTSPAQQSINAPRTTGSRPDSLLTLLTDREHTVLGLLEQRLSYKEIGERLYISPLTVKRHAGNIYDKLGANNRREAVGRAYEMGFTSQSDPH